MKMFDLFGSRQRVFIAAALLTGALGLAASLQAQEKMPAGFEDYTAEALAATPQIHAIFQRSCQECHDETQRRPKGGFGFVMDFARMRTDEDYIVLGDPDDSEIYLLITDPDPDWVMPPPDSDYPPLSDAEIELVETWIIGGAPAQKTAEAYEEAIKAVAVVEDENPEKAETGEETELAIVLPETEDPGKVVIDPKPVDDDSLLENARQIFAKFHPLIVHFPIALFMVAGLIEVRRLFGRGATLEPAISWCLGVGVLGAIATAVTGWNLVDVVGYSDGKVFNHRWLGVGTTALGLFTTASWFRFRMTRHRAAQTCYWIGMAALVILVGFAGHTGGELVYGKGYPFN